MRLETETSGKGRGKLGAQFTDGTITHWQRYKSTEDISGLKQRWTAVNQISATIPDLVFNRIESVYAPKDVWQKLELFEGKSRRLLAGLVKKFQNTRCGENGDIRAHLEKLAVLREKLSSLDQQCQVRLGHTSGFESSVDSLVNSYEANDKDLTLRLSCRPPSSKWSSTKKKSDASARARTRHYREECWANGGGREGQGPMGHQER